MQMTRILYQFLQQLEGHFTTFSGHFSNEGETAHLACLDIACSEFQLDGHAITLQITCTYFHYRYLLMLSLL